MQTLPTGARPANPSRDHPSISTESFDPILTMDDLHAFRRNRWPGIQAWLSLGLGMATKSHAELIESTREIRDCQDRGESDADSIEALEGVQSLRAWLEDTAKIIRAVEHRMLLVIDQVGRERGEGSVFTDDHTTADAFDNAYAEVCRLKAIENAMTFNTVEEEQEHEAEYHEATSATDGTRSSPVHPRGRCKAGGPEATHGRQLLRSCG